MTEKVTTGLLKRRRVLIIDSNDELRRALHVLLEGEGWQVIDARHQDEGIARAVEGRPAVVVLNAEAPEGEPIAEELRRAVPGEKIVTFSPTQERIPPWADGGLPKHRLYELPLVLKSVTR